MKYQLAVGICLTIAPRHPGDHSRQIAVEQPDTDIQRALVIEDTKLSVFRRRLAFIWIPLRKVTALMLACGRYTRDDIAPS
jgi:hypothetical protein